MLDESHMVCLQSVCTVLFLTVLQPCQVPCCSSCTPQGSTIFPYLWTQKTETSSERLNELHKVLELGSNGGRLQIQISVTTGSASSYSSMWPKLTNAWLLMPVAGISASYERLLSISMRSILCRGNPVLWVPSLLEALRMLHSIPCVAIGNE